jgi:drug/metabolite transporter (DMT)-like permease
LYESNNLLKAKVELHIAVLLFGFTAILGKALTLNTFTLVWWRMVFAIVFFIGYFYFKKRNLIQILSQIPTKFIGVGFIIGIHWYCFYGAVKLSHVSVALMCMSLTTLFTTLLEPLILKKKFDKIDFLISLIFVPLMYWLIDGVKDFNLIGFIIGVLAALFASIFSLYNKGFVDDKMDTTLLSFYEFIGVFIFCTPLAIYYFLNDGLLYHTPTSSLDLICILALSILCTNLAFLLCVNSLKQIPIFDANLIVGLEPVYGIALSFVFFKENQYLNVNFYLASLFIFALIFLHPIIKQKIKTYYAK